MLVCSGLIVSMCLLVSKTFSAACNELQAVISQQRYEFLAARAHTHISVIIATDSVNESMLQLGLL